jgi:single-stranded-DNA-specific exonuclease
MERATARILAAIDSKEKIVVHGDYDADGISATALLIRVLGELGATCSYYIPNRLTDGYGVTEDGVRTIARGGATLLVTVDCGITAINEIGVANACGMDVIVTDHHVPKEDLPEAIAILNPKIPGSSYPDKDLAGVGVVLKLCQGLCRKSGSPDSLWENHLDLASLGTCADIVPLMGENRIITKFGFERMRTTDKPGLAALIEINGLTGKPMTTSAVAFQIAPSINAAGRLGSAASGIELLLTDDLAVARHCAEDLRNSNYERRAINQTVWDEACAWVQAHCSPEKDFAIVVGNAGWHAGVIGIVASKLVEKYHRPALLFSIGNDGMARGSGRSIPGLHLLDVLGECSDLLETFGGHAAAAGMNIKAASIDAFRERFNEAVRRKVSPSDLVPVVVADAEAGMQDLTPKLFSLIKAMEPFGPGNARPLLYCRGLIKRGAPKIVGKNHLKMTVSGEGTTMDAIAFNFGDRIDEIKAADEFSLAFSLDENEWNDTIKLQMKVKGISV